MLGAWAQLPGVAGGRGTLRLRRLATASRALQACVRRAGVGGEVARSPAPGGKVGGLMADRRSEVHHRVPWCLLGSFDRAASGGLDGAGLQAWFEWEEEAYRYGVNPYISREDLASLIESSTVPLPVGEHRAGHSQAGDFVRWGRRGGLATLARYGRGWFVLLAHRRWRKIGPEALDSYRAEIPAKVGAA